MTNKFKQHKSCNIHIFNCGTSLHNHAVYLPIMDFNFDIDEISLFVYLSDII